MFHIDIYDMLWIPFVYGTHTNGNPAMQIMQYK